MKSNIFKDYNKKTKNSFSRKDIIINDINEISIYVEKAYKKEDLNIVLHYGIIKKHIIDKIKKGIKNKPSSGWNLLSNNYELAIKVDSFLHISKRKILIGISDVICFAQYIPYIISNFDSVEYSKNNINQGLKFKKKINNDIIVSFILVSNKKKRFLIKSISFDKETYKKRSISPTANDKP